MDDIHAIRPILHDDVIMAKDAKEFEDWYFQYYGINAAHKAGRYGQGVRVGIVDTGVSNHRDIRVYIGEDGRKMYHPTTDNKYDVDGHGTHVAGIIAAIHNGTGTKGIAPQVELVMMKGLNDNGSGSTSDIISSLYRLAALNVKLVNLSLGLNGHNVALDNCITELYERHGIICFCAAGNDGKNDDLDFPGKHPLTICVGSHSKTGQRSVYSDTGDFLDVYGAGERILSTIGTENYQLMSGTSMATPQVLAMFALYYNDLTLKYKGLVIDDFKDFINEKQRI